MSYRVLIIDDNHSFIDSLQVMLKDFAFQYDHSLRFQEGERKIRESGLYINRGVLQKLTELDSATQRETPKKKSEEETPVEPIEPVSIEIDGQPFNNNGYFLILVEQNTESSLKGLDFIQTLTRQGIGISESDFILMTDRPDALEAKAKAAGISLQEKPVRAAAIRQLVQAKLKNLQDIQNKVESLLTRINIQNGPAEQPAKEKKSRTTKAKNIVRAVTGKSKKKTK